MQMLVHALSPTMTSLLSDHIESLPRHQKNNEGHHSHHGDSFDPEQAAMLQEMARSGGQPESHSSPYEFSDTGVNGAQLNGLSSSHEDIDLDPAALLESLANFEHPPSNNTSISTDHFASLLQAAATAGNHESQDRQNMTRRRTRKSKSTPEPLSPNTTKRKRGSNDDNGDTPGFLKNNRKKNKKLTTDEEAIIAREREIWGSENEEEDDDSSQHFGQHFDHPPVKGSDARAVGVHSAAALFRRPTSAAKKYTRPPMSRVFTSLELSPEMFLNLQAAAKKYMLDPDHPERRDCVGNRGSGDGTMVRLKLFECVRLFLDEQGWGLRCWGPEAPGVEVRNLAWPKMSHKILTLVTPLLRRIVTNERQRLYAVETRRDLKDSKEPDPKPKAGTKKSNSKGTATGSTRNGPQTPASDVDHQNSPAQHPHIDPKLDQYHYSLDHSFPGEPSELGDHGTDQQAQNSFLHTPDESMAKFHINILSSNQRIRPKITLNRSTCPAFPSLVQHIHNLLGDQTMQMTSIRALGAEGLVDVTNEVEWEAIVNGVEQLEWMDGDVKVVVDVQAGSNDLATPVM